MMKLRTVIAIAATAIVLAACSSNASSSSSASSPAASGSMATSASAAGGMSAASYADAVCSDVTTWQKAIKSESTSFQADVSNATSPDAVKTALEGFLTSVVDDTQTMVNDIKALGAPAVDGGEEAHTALVNGLTSIQTVFQTALDNVKSTSSSDPQALAKALQGIGTDIQNGTQDMQNALSGLSNPGLDTAFNDTPSCQALQQG
jgi:predicted small secreted protein